MRQDVAIIREDTRATLVVDGATLLDWVRPGRVTQHPVPDRTHVSDHVVLLPDGITIDAIVSPSPGRADLTSGPERLREVEQYLDECRTQSPTLSVLRPGGGLIRSLVLEQYDTSEGNSDALRVSMRFVAIQIATSRTTQVAATRGKPVEAARAAVDDPETETGQGATKEEPRTSALFSLADGLTEGAQALGAQLFGGQ